jgi:ribosomal protein S18 acetylase RimI-like enzyme
MLIKVLNKEFLENNVNEFLELVSSWKYCSWKKENFMYELPQKWNFSFAVYDNNKPQGFCIASNKISDAYYIHLFFVSEESRGKDIGTAMIDQAKEMSRSNGLKRIELRCPETNAGALSFYQKKNFKILNRVKDETSGPEADYYLALTL